jgi:hypothetical protein
LFALLGGLGGVGGLGGAGGLGGFISNIIRLETNQPEREQFVLV